jgi:hypothetical protein
MAARLHAIANVPLLSTPSREAIPSRRTHLGLALRNFCLAIYRNRSPWNLGRQPTFSLHLKMEEETMGFGKGALLWLLGVPLPIIILLALFWHH